MKTKLKNIILIAAVFALGSCTEIIDIELNSAMERIVVEARITDLDEPFVVNLSRTTDYFNPNEPEKVGKAKVTLSTNTGQSVILVEMEAGNYQSSFIRGISGTSYTLNIEEGDEVYEAVATMPSKVMIDSLVYEWFGSFNPNDSLGGGYMLNCWYTDPANEENFYMFTAEKLNKSDIPEPDFPGSGVKILMSDALSNGKSSLMNLNRRGLYELGDTVKVELISIDQNTYNYFDQLAEVSGGGPGFGSSAPANPENNISNGAMGYFSAETIDTRTVVIR